jgi:hypothetical protein
LITNPHESISCTLLLPHGSCSFLLFLVSMVFETLM